MILPLPELICTIAKVVAELILSSFYVFVENGIQIQKGGSNILKNPFQGYFHFPNSDLFIQATENSISPLNFHIKTCSALYPRLKYLRQINSSS